MKKTFKKIAAAVMAVATLAVGITGMTASAGQLVGNYGTFTWSTRTAQTVNNTARSRRVTASVTVFKDSTGVYVTMDSDSDNGGNGTDAYASVLSSSYPSSSYNFKLNGSIGNSTNSNAGTAESWTQYAN